MTRGFDAPPPEGVASPGPCLVTPRSTARVGRRGVRSPGGFLVARRAEAPRNDTAEGDSHDLPPALRRPRPSCSPSFALGLFPALAHARSAPPSASTARSSGPTRSPTRTRSPSSAASTPTSASTASPTDPSTRSGRWSSSRTRWIQVTVLPEIGGKIWTAVEKSTGKSFIYDNHVVKFRDIAMRGPWTSGGIEAELRHHRPHAELRDAGGLRHARGPGRQRLGRHRRARPADPHAVAARDHAARRQGVLHDALALAQRDAARAALLHVDERGHQGRRATCSSSTRARTTSATGAR